MRERRREPRIRRRFPCRVVVRGASYSGIVLDLSPSGLFVQTNARPAPKEVIGVDLQPPGQAATLALRARVERIALAPPGLTSALRGGIGLSLLEASDRLLALCGGAPVPRARKAQEAASAALPVFRVRMASRAGPRSKSILVQCASEADAEALALGQLDEAWKVLDVSPM